MSIFKRIVKYEKVELICLGVILPLALMLFTTYKLVFSEVAFFGRGRMAEFYGIEAYFVSLFWYGIALCFFAGFFMRYLKKGAGKDKTFIIGFISISIGLASVLWFTFRN